MQDNEVLYVGITKQDIRRRLRYGFSAKGENGYHGYKWKDLNEVQLLVWAFRDSNNEDVEAIEADIPKARGRLPFVPTYLVAGECWRVLPTAGIMGKQKRECLVRGTRRFLLDNP
jgi:hypothetical protein